MTQLVFNKRIHFVANAIDAGHDAITANDWYCSLTIKERKSTTNPELLERFAKWLPTSEVTPTQTMEQE